MRQRIGQMKTLSEGLVTARHPREGGDPALSFSACLRPAQSRLRRGDGFIFPGFRTFILAPATIAFGLLSVWRGGQANAAPRDRQAQAVPAPTACCPIVELRQYTLYPGQRDVLISMFESKFIESQEAVGIRVTGLFHDINDADRFVWIRGFDSMEARKRALTDFYYGPVWGAYREQANATLYDNDNVLLLHPAAPGSGFDVDAAARPAIGEMPERNDFVVGTIYYFDGAVPGEFIERFDRELMPSFEKSGARVLARYVSEKSANTFERLPVREKDNVFVWFAGFADRQAYDRYIDALARDERWSGEQFATLRKALQRPPEILMLRPTPRSLVGH